MNWFKKLIAGSEYARQEVLLEKYRQRINELDSQLKDFDKMKLRLTIYEECSGMKEGVEAAIEKITAQQLAGEQQRYLGRMAAMQSMNFNGLGGQAAFYTSQGQTFSTLLGGVLR